MQISHSPYSLALGLAAILAATGCQSPEVGLPVDGKPSTPEAGISAPGASALAPAEKPAFEREAVEIKSRVRDAAAFDAAMEELAARYGLTIPEAPLPIPSSASPASGPAPAAPEAGKGAAAKAAAAVYVWKTVKNAEVAYPFVIYHGMTVPVNHTLDVYTEQVSDLVDPFLVAFYQTSGDASSQAYTVKVVGLDDDGRGGRNAQIVWKNTTGASRYVEVIAFAYSSRTTGDARLRYFNLSTGGYGTVSGRITATRITGNLPVNTDGCSSPSYSRIILTKQTGIRYGSGLFGMNLSAMRGGNVRDFDAGVSMQDVLRAGGGDFLLPYLKHDPSRIYGPSRYLATQNDRTLCEQ